jgi:hypothetical protein
MPPHGSWPPSPHTRRFADTWGELVPKEHGEVPRDTEHAIEVKRAQLEALKASAPAGAEVPTYQTAYAQLDATARMRMNGKDPEASFRGAYKVMRAGV